MDDVLIRFRLVGDEARALRSLAATDLRDPRDQVRYIVRDVLVSRGLLPPREQSLPNRDASTCAVRT